MKNIVIETGTLTLSGSAVVRENPLPKLRERAFHKSLPDAGLLPGEREGFGYMTGFRVLPYRMQDGYDRSCTPLELETISLENELLRAVFLPGYGGRLYSLYHKGQGRELLFCNPALRMGNLAVRNAWFSGGVEWNLGQYGHSTLTAAPVYFARCQTPEGRPFLRMYEYERVKGLFIQLDFHLLPGDGHLHVHAKLQNPHDDARSLYYWTNTAAVLNDGLRVLSGSREVIATVPENGINTFSHDQMPRLKMLPGKDACRPVNFPFSAEYFFQNPPQPRYAWEAAAYEEGWALYERSTTALPYRKMFCWSNKRGGIHWQRLLSTEEAPLYVEIQAGLSPTQLHGRDLAPHQSVSFTQAFGMAATETELTHGAAYNEACDHMHAQIETVLPYARLNELEHAFAQLTSKHPDALLHRGSGYALVEATREQDFVPEGLRFELSYSSEEYRWHMFARGGALPAFEEGMANSFLTDNVWLPRLEQAFEVNPTVEATFHLALALYENGQFNRAEALMEQAAAKSDLPLCWRTLAAMRRGGGRLVEANLAMEKALATGNALDAAYYEEAIALLVECGRPQEAWKCYKSASAIVQADERVKLKAAPAAFEVRAFDFLDELFKYEPATVREGEISLTELWFKVRAARLVQQEGIPIEEAEAKARTEQPPYRIDLRTNE